MTLMPQHADSKDVIQIHLPLMYVCGERMMTVVTE